MTMILQDALPVEMLVEKPLPGMAPCGPMNWLRVDDAYAQQMAYRIDLMALQPDKVLCCDAGAVPAAHEILAEALKVLPTLGFEVRGREVHCPDGRRYALDHSAPLRTLAHLVQEDICILQKRGNEHVLTAAAVCFPANWRLAEKQGRPLSAIHVPVAEYDAGIARRVQRLFDGVQTGKPLWRFNRLPYGNADLHQPNRQDAKLAKRFIRSERQCILRLPKTNAVVFTIHTYVVNRG